MIEKYNRYKILREFFNFPRMDFHIRQICRLTKISQPSVINHLKELLNENLIIKEKKSIYPTFRANRENEHFKIYKKLDIILRINKTGLINYIYDSCLPNSIILFGSASKGEDIKESDIDLFVQSKEKKLDLKKYSKLLNREVSLFFQEDFNKLNKEIKNNIINGIILKGYLKVF